MDALINFLRSLGDRARGLFGALNRKNRLALVILGVAILLLFFLIGSRPSAHVEPAAEPVFAVRTLAVTPQSLTPTVNLYGRVTAPSRSTLTAAVNANVLAVPVRPGDRVPAGGILVELDQEEAGIAVEQQRANLQQAEAAVQLEQARQGADEKALDHQQEMLRLRQKELSRAKSMHARGLISDAELDAVRQNLRQQSLATDQAQLAVAQGAARLNQLRAQLSSAEATLRRAELDLRRTTVTAPFAAAVIDVTVAPGDRVGIGQRLVEIYDRTGLEVRAQIPSRYLDAVRAGLEQKLPMSARIRSGNAEVPATLRRLSASGAAGGLNGWFAVQAEGLAVDSNVHVAMQLPATDNAVAVPFEAVYELSRIYRLREGRLDGLTVERLGDFMGPGGEQLVLVRNPALQSGDRIVVTHLPNAVTGLRVQVIE